ncbi:hypothetical protein GALL_221210 [mine drainage metagenome]|uniref:Tetratricopeptide repeat protein n=1 Tax=mine drainage metagenome TaxID=410659 RepID=A0A1J5S282_9ZZZZ
MTARKGKGKAALPPRQGMTIEQAIAAAYGHWTAGQAAQAEHLCRQVLAAWPEHPDALHLLGLLAHGSGNRGARSTICAGPARHRALRPCFTAT